MCAASFLFVTTSSQSGAEWLRSAVDPGPRGGAASAGDPLPGLTPSQLEAFEEGKDAFEEAEGVGEGIGPRFNAESCGACHSQPASGGSSPATNSQVASAAASGARNTVPSFVRSDGPVREVRFKHHADGTRDGGVHALYVVNGRLDATGDATPCAIAQDDFESAAAAGNAIFRIPTPIFGAGLIEQISDAAIVANADSGWQRKSSRGIRGRPSRTRNDSGTTNLNGNDGTVARFGWKATAAGRRTRAQNKSLLLFSGVRLYSDLLLHNMGPGLADHVVQAQAGPDEFRTAPLWGLGQRLFLLHDGRTSDLGEAIRQHRSDADSRFAASEANVVVDTYGRLSEHDKQDLLNFLRSL
jgi:CxxC motif-containing protein (DUF1111 family)